MGREMREDETPTVPLIVVRVTAETARVDEFVVRFARYFRGDDIVFVPTEGIQPPGRRVRFIFALADGSDLVSGEGVVLRMRRDSGDVRRPPGMELRYQILDEQSQIVVERLLAARQPTPPPYVSMRIDGVSDSQQVTLPHQTAEPTPPPIPRAPPPIPSAPPPIPLLPTMVKSPPPVSLSLPSPSSPSSPSLPQSRTPTARMATLARLPAPPSPDAARGLPILGLGIATAAAMLAMAIAMAMIRHAPPRVVGVGGNGVVIGPSVSPAGVAPPVAAGPRPASTGGARPPPSAPRARAGARPVALHVTSSPTGSIVFVDGEERGPSPLTVAVASGAHDIVVERPRWISAHAHVDGREVGATPLDLDAAAYELHHLQLELEGHVWKRKIYLRPSGGLVRVGGNRRSVDEPGAVRVAHDLGERVRP